jgi:OmcA/MtrC family decaheme c-type cytochrome
VYPAVAAKGGLLRPAPAKKVLATITGNVARRVVVDNNKCNACHDQLGTSPNFHGNSDVTRVGVGSGPRNDATMCSICHNVNRTSSGWSANASTFIHGIHGGGKRTNIFTWTATATSNYGRVTYPAILNNCEQCHVPGSYDFSNSANAAAIPNLLWTTSGTGTYATGPSTSPFVQVATGTPLAPNYGKGFSFTVATGVTLQAEAATLVSSPITAACASCHDSAVAIAHFKGNGGTFYQARGTGATSVFATNVEQCLICHGNGKTADIRAVHMTWK